MKVRQWPDGVLSKVCPAVPLGQDVSRECAELRRALELSHRGIAIAANQLGIELRIIHVKFESTDWMIVNPEFVMQRGVIVGKESCLSFEHGNRVVMCQRFRQVKVAGTNEFWQTMRVGGKGLHAVALQHEVDHLDGLTMLDREFVPAT